METLLTFLAGWISTLSGVALGGWLVYRTKRDPYDSMFSRERQGASFNIDDDFDRVDDSNPELPEATTKANNAFINQFAERMAKK
jgi:purine-cytosine permease-like protein